jgi:hypothetical protein
MLPLRARADHRFENQCDRHKISPARFPRARCSSGAGMHRRALLAPAHRGLLARLARSECRVSTNSTLSASREPPRTPACDYCALPRRNSAMTTGSFWRPTKISMLTGPDASSTVSRYC